MDSATRIRVRNRAGDVCEYCQLPQGPFPFSLFHIEHIVPRKHGGATLDDNLCLACLFGLTAIGRVTVRVLDMNDPERVELRHAVF